MGGAAPAMAMACIMRHRCASRGPPGLVIASELRRGKSTQHSLLPVFVGDFLSQMRGQAGVLLEKLINDDMIDD